MNLTALACTTTAAVLLHNTEEALYLPRWSQFAGRWHAPVGKLEFRFAVVVLSLAFVALAIASVALGVSSTLVQTLFAGYVAAMVANALVPHLAATLFLRRYMPGTATAWLLVVPSGALYLVGAVQQHRVELSTMLWAGPLVAAGLVLCIPVLLRAGRRLWPESHRAGA